MPPAAWRRCTWPACSASAGFQRFFAIKRLHPHLGADETFVGMFLDEARIVAGIRHPNVVPVLEVGAGEAGYYLVMEYIEGDSLGALLTRGLRAGRRLPSSVAVRVMLDVLAGLHAAHELRDAGGRLVDLVHRDVSPQNILIDADGVARISDFGVAHAALRMSSTRTGQLKGKVAYMAPEQARTEEVTRRADVFAAGIVLWEALCQQRLFLADNEAVTLNRLVFEPIPRLRERNPAMHVALEAVLARALERDPSRRFGSAAAFAEALEAAALEARMLGGAADVRAYLMSVMGSEIEGRREVVRAHLADLDARRARDGSRSEWPRAAAALPPSGSVPAPPAGTPSSVSSAVMAIPPLELDAAPPAESSAPRASALAPDTIVTRGPGRARWAWVVAAGVVAAGVLGLGAYRWAVRSLAPSASSSGSGFPVPSSAEAHHARLSAPSGAEAPGCDGAPACPGSAAAEPAASASEKESQPTGEVVAVENLPAEPSAGHERRPPSSPAPATGRQNPPSPLATTPGESAPSQTVVPPSATDDLKRNPYR